MKNVLLATLAIPAFLSACAVQQAASPADRNEGEVVTGSRIPHRGGGGSGSVGTMGGGDYRQGQMERSGNGGLPGT